eukprot:TRINITY_DN72855_c0_g1_i1.p1 TRINITY_DN72855_c0_g1~~TRINITY_DN72855_c0_g1_i1.p1  ORF type:complete len:236 (-),score=39.24 TRINITY_DN72855_c0_g1_i1:161-868(-)
MQRALQGRAATALVAASLGARRLSQVRPLGLFDNPNFSRQRAALRRQALLSGTRNLSNLTNMTKPIVVATTEDSDDKANKVAEAAKALEGAAVNIETIQSYYWWEGKVQFDPEWRVVVTTTSPFDASQAAIEKAHSYDTPMIIYDLDEVPADHVYWRGVIDCGEPDAATALAKTLVEHRVVACAQATSAGHLAVKTVASCKGKVAEAAPAVKWSAIGGNADYLKWLVDECVGAKS